MISLLIGLIAVSAAVFFLISERRGMYFRLFTRYYFTPRIAVRMRIVKTGYDEKGEIAILEGAGLAKSYALPCLHLPGRSPAGVEEVFIYRQKYPSDRNIYRYSAMETELLAMGRAVDNSVTVVKGARRIESNEEWRTINLIVHTLSLLLYGSFLLCAVTLLVYVVSGGTASTVPFAFSGVISLALKLAFKAERHGPALRVYADVIPVSGPVDDAFIKAADRIGLDENERRAFLREQERREIFEKMNPRFNEFYLKLQEMLKNTDVPPGHEDVLTAAAKAEMDRVCFSPSAHPLTKAEAMRVRESEMAESCAQKPDADDNAEKERSRSQNKAPDAKPKPVPKAKQAASDAPGAPAPEMQGLNATKTESNVESSVSYAETSDGEKIEVEEVDETLFGHSGDAAASVQDIEPIIIQSEDEAAAGAAVNDVGPDTPDTGASRTMADRPPSQEDFSEILRGSKIICTTCGSICNAPKMSNWTKTKCPECRGTIKRNSR